MSWGPNTKFQPITDAYRNNPIWDKKKDKVEDSALIAKLEVAADRLTAVEMAQKLSSYIDANCSGYHCLLDDLEDFIQDNKRGDK